MQCHRRFYVNLCLCFVLTCCLVVVASADFGSSNSKSDRDLTFEPNEERTRAIDDSRSHHHLLRRRAKSEELEESAGWFASAVNRIRRSVGEYFKKPNGSTFNRKTTKRKRHVRVARQNDQQLVQQENEDDDSPDIDEDNYEDEYNYGDDKDDDDENPGASDEYDDAEERTPSLGSLEIDSPTTMPSNNQFFEEETTTTTTTQKPYSGFLDERDDDEDNLISSGEISGNREYPTPFLPDNLDKNMGDVKSYYRITVVIREPYIDMFDDRNSPPYRKFADDLKGAIEDIYKSTPGINSLSVISIQKRPSDLFTSKVILDLGMSSNEVDDKSLENILLSHIRNKRRIGSYEALEDEFKFEKSDAPYHTCEEHEIPCRSGKCINVTSRCDGISDCSDNSDEEGCPNKVCSNNEFSCDLTRCILDKQKCDGRLDCEDGTDEHECSECNEGAFKCDDSKCVLLSKRCDGDNDCNDKSDEENCVPVSQCQPGQFQCQDRRCINEYQVCDRRHDCPGGEDERNCPAKCGAEEHRCGDGKCVPLKARCDRKYDCLDQSDEKKCPCQLEDFRCQNGFCIPPYQRCDGIHNCQDGSDEDYCASTTPCASSQWRCKDGTCIENRQKCDGFKDCPDNSDELSCETCKIDQFTCRNGSCINLSKRCDGVADCLSGEDEISCANCNYGEYKCTNGQCISLDKLCDQTSDCVDGSDEKNCTNAPSTCRPDELTCNDGSCVYGKKCDRIFDCRDGSDESDCPFCSPSQFRCLSGECIDDFLRCDSKSDCYDGSDERGCDYTCPDGKFRCTDGLCLDPNRVCDGYADCSDSIDEANCNQPDNTTQCRDTEFECIEGNECIPGYLVCNGRHDCRDGSDEYHCGPAQCASGEFTCADGSCISSHLQCNGRPDCPDRSDEYECQPTPIPSRCGYGQHTCASGQCILASQVCDGRVNCDDMSDENGCPGTSANLDLETPRTVENQTEGGDVVLMCRDRSASNATVQWIRSNGLPLPPGANDRQGRLEIYNVKIEDAGEYICKAVDYPPTARGAQITVQVNVQRYIRPPVRPPSTCSPNEATCSNGDCIPKQLVCNGRKDCTDGSDESRCKECEPDEFRCSNKQCVSKFWQCDGQSDCLDGSDEQSCVRNNTGICKYDEFACHSNSQCIPRSFHCDLQNDCRDRSDEIGCSDPLIVRPPPPRAQLKIGETFEISCKAIGVPVPLIAWRLNWGHIPPKCRTTSENGVGTLICPDIQVQDQGAYTCEALTSTKKILASDTILEVENTNVCRPGYFNDDARSEGECIKCFCFGQAGSCRSADLFIYHYQPPFDILKVVGVQVEPSNSILEIRDEPIYRNADPVLTAVGPNGVNAYLPPQAELNQQYILPYFAMPENYHGNQLKSYGGHLRYTVRHSNRNYELPGPDVILTGNGYTLLHHAREKPQSFENVNMAVRFFEGEWVKRSYNAPETPASREDIMMALANIDNILIKLQYNEGSLNTTLSNIIMESASTPDNNLGATSYVEECSCPPGYSGLSCEKCADGYERHRSALWLGQCYKAPDSCPAGTYGDPSRGIDCQPCPCPLQISSNQFGRTCSLANDGDVICNCPTGYTGRRCEQCAPGYEGNPLTPGGSCKSATCKQNVDGPNCDHCKADTFHLSPANQHGCISCFCMALTSKCGSSNYYRNQISSAFTSSINDFKILDIDNPRNPISEGITLNSSTREITYSSFRSPNIYYWILPSSYLGNKLTSYGGYLRFFVKYIPHPGGQSSRNSAADVILESNNNVVLYYYAKDQAPPVNRTQSFAVPILEQYWQTSNGQQADRKFLLMALADVKSIHIKATYTTNTMEAALISVSLDTASPRSLGSFEKALEVEHCYCPEGYQGLSCEDCSFGYTRVPGIYLGYCEPCNCNGHSNDCDPQTGQCFNCRNHTAGDHCESCLDGYEGDPLNGIPCKYAGTDNNCICDPRGSISNQCYNGACTCKTNVEGNRCDRCRPGTYGLNLSLPMGCESCFCSGVSRECSESSYYIEQIPTQILDENHGFTLTDQYLSNRINSNFQLNYAENKITYHFKPYENQLYWSVPQILAGNQIKSYGGKLVFSQEYTEFSPSSVSSNQDVIIVGDQVTIFWSNPDPIRPNRLNRVSVPIDTTGRWQKISTETGPQLASREDILIALSKIREILIRAQLTATTETSSLSDVYLDTAIEPPTEEGRATSVEICRCPIGYEGSSCESCSLGYYRDPNDIVEGPLGSCTKCQCSEHAIGCSLGPQNLVICNCIPGYSGIKCEERDSGRGTPPPPTREPPQVTINVTITAPNIQIYEIGSSAKLNCSAISYRTNQPARVQWIKDGGYLSDNAIDDSHGTLIITNLKVSDSGRYICEAQDGYSIVTKDITVIVGAPERPRVVVSPSYVDITEGRRIEIQCFASGSPAPNYLLRRSDSQPLNPMHHFENGIFSIDRILISDGGIYECSAQNPSGEDVATFEIFVRGSEFVRVDIEPPSARVSAGESITLRCLSPNSYLDVYWEKENGELPYNAIEENGVLKLNNAQPSDSGTYVCTITSQTGASGTGTSNVEIVENRSTPPEVSVTPQRLSVLRGATAEFSCRVSGSPTPSVKWIKLNGNSDNNLEQIGTTLYIRNADRKDEGTYMCSAQNPSGLVQERVTLSITQQGLPIIRIYPNSTQQVIAGHSLDLRCDDETGSATQLTWSRQNFQPLSSNVYDVERGTIRFYKITKNEEGEYVCTGENEFGTATAVVNIYVQTLPEIYIIPNQETINRNENENLRLECRATGNPAPTVYWSKHGADGQNYIISRGSAVQDFNRLSKADEGLYVCYAQSPIGTSSKRVQLIVDTLPARGDITGEDATSGSPRYKDNEKSRDKYGSNTDSIAQSFTAPAGMRAELRCSFSWDNGETDEVNIDWVRPGNKSLSLNAYIRDGTLTIDSTQESDQGLYSCVVTRKSDGRVLFTQNSNLNIISPPNIMLEPKRQVVHPGDNAYIQCSATGQQPITITWTSMGRDLPTSAIISGGLLQFVNIKITDAGRYRCKAVNSAGEADAVADVFVQETQYKPVITPANKSPVAPVGSSVTLQCGIHREGTNDHVRWYRENLPLPLNSAKINGQSLQITNVQRADEGRYYCEIPSSEGYLKDYVDLHVTGPSPVTEAVLHLYPPERNFHLGENVEISCQSTQRGVITTWSKPSGWLADNVENIGGTLRINDLKSENAGVYRCEANGDQGMYHKDYNLNIIEENDPRVKVETKVAPKGSGIVLECRTNLQEPIRYIWSKQGGDLPRYVDPRQKSIQLNELESSDAGLYICNAENQYRKVEIPVILVITGIVPYFTQAPESYIALPMLMDPYIRFNFEISFKPETEDGLILYNSNKHENKLDKSSDFISLALVRGVPEFRFNIRHSSTIVRGTPISIGHWHTIKVIRNQKRVTMYVDKNGPFIGNSDSSVIGLDLSHTMYLGGVPNIRQRFGEVGVEKGFVGCISTFKTGNESQDILKDAIKKEGVTNCETCSENRCQNKGICQESLSNKGYICICPPGYSGETCNKLKSASCTPYSCGSGKCIDNEKSYDCSCPLGSAGSRCERSISVRTPSFKNHAYLTYSIPTQRRIKYSLKIKPNSNNDGILLYCGESDEKYGEFSSISIKDQQVEFRYDLGYGASVLRSPRKVVPGEWIVITASRNVNEGRLIVNGDEAVVERSNIKSRILLPSYLYVGGVNVHKVRINDDVGVTDGFDGCISDINVGGTEIEMINSAVESSNVQDCSNNNENNEVDSSHMVTPYNHRDTGCSNRPCQNDGQCTPTSPTSYTCNCINGYSGINCEIAPNQCDYLKPCENSGSCHGNSTSYRCDCTLGFSGTNCEQRSEIQNDVHFDGNGYLEFNRSYLSEQNDDKEEIVALELSTNTSNGLIFWHGQSPNEDPQGKDYLALAVVNGNLEFTYDLGSGPAIIYNTQVRIDDGNRHLVILKRNGKIGSIEVDQQIEQGQSEGSTKTLNRRGNIYLGGAPNISFMTSNKYHTGFVGCIHNFELNNFRHIDLGKNAISGLNVKPCSSFEGIYSYSDADNNLLF